MQLPEKNIMKSGHISINKLVIHAELVALGLVLIVLLLSSLDRGNGGKDPETTEQTDQVRIAESARQKAEASRAALFADIHVPPRQREVWFGDLDEMLKRGQLRILIPFSRTFFFRADGQELGVSTGILTYYEEFLNEQVLLGEKKMELVFLPTPQENLLEDLSAGKGDIAVAADTDLRPAREQEERVTLVSPVATEIREILVTGPDAPRFKSIFNLSGRTVTIREGSPYAASLHELNSTLTSIGRKPVTVRLADAFLTDADLLEMTAAGLLPMTVVDSHIGAFWAQVFPELTLHNKIVLRTAKEIHWATRADNRLLQESISYFKKNSYLPRDGYPALTGYYRKKDGFLRNSLKLSALERYHRLAGLFAQYGQEYNFPPLLLAALAYQESELGEAGKAGEITGLDPAALLRERIQADLKQLQRPEENIQTAARYLRLLADRYFSSPELGRFNQNLMAVAAYKFGPEQVIAARKRAALAGYNPDIWFNHVETAVQAEEGGNTADSADSADVAQYVRNIYKYYKAYEYFLERTKNESQPEETAGDSL